MVTDKIENDIRDLIDNARSDKVILENIFYGKALNSIVNPHFVEMLITANDFLITNYVIALEKYIMKRETGQ